MVDADMVSCCLHVFVLSICRRSNCGDGGNRITITDAEADLISEELE